MLTGLRIFGFFVLVFIAFKNIGAQGMGSVDSVRYVENGLAVYSNSDVVIFKACKYNILKVDYIPSGSESRDTLIVGNTKWDMVPVSIDTAANPMVFQTAKFKVLIAKNPIRFSIYDSTGQQLCSEQAATGINKNGIYLNTSGGNFYGLHNSKSASLKLTTGGNIYVGSQGSAGAPFVWTTKGWGIIGDLDSGRVEYTTNTLNFLHGVSGTGSITIKPANPTVNDTITIMLPSKKTAYLHWGVNYNGHSWTMPESLYWPAGSTLYSDKVAVESAFAAPVNDTITIKIGPFNNAAQVVAGLAFVIRYSDNTWDNNSGQDYHINYASQTDSSAKKNMDFYFVFGSPVEVFTGMTDVTGKPPLFPKYTMGFINTQWGIDQTELLSIVTTYRQKGIPIDTYVLDFDWMDWGADNYGEFRWGTKFPMGPTGALTDSLSKIGMKLFGIRKPRIHTGTVEGTYAKNNNFFVDYTTDYFSNKQVGRLNFNKPEVRQWYWDTYVNKGNAYNLGIVGYWNDEADEYGDNFNFMQMQRSEYEGQRAYNNKRVWSINRNFFLGAQRYAYGHWSGDISTGFNNMADQAPFMLSSIMLGSSWWGMDIGGFNGTPSNDNYYRWMEFGAFVPIYRVHGQNGLKRYPWYFGAYAEQIATSYIKIRYKLLPYIYTAAWFNHNTGVSITRPLPMCYPDDNACADIYDEWMFGDNFLVKPVLNQSVTSVSVYLPEGTWIDYWNGKTYKGKSSMSYPVTDSTIALFVKAGSVIPTAPVGKYTDDATARKSLIFSCYPGGNSSGYVYEDDGETYQYENGAYATTAFTQIESAKYTDISIDARLGSFVPYARDYITEFNFSKTRPDSVSINGIKNSRIDVTTLLNTSVTGWAYDSLKAKIYSRFADNGLQNSVRLFRTNITEVEQNNLPLSYELTQNYPNPFNPATTIRYQIAKEGRVNMTVYDILGKEIMRLVDEVKAPGSYSAVFNGSGLATGMYFYRISVNDFTTTKKMMLIK